mmetsp:Transcript_15168/g.35640  ORF Transcript_15168/g.35640 Transcript_15168/m.35640 type:complete len:217 (+) Transcript_15168:216-866(+)
MGSGASTNMEGSIMSTQPVGHMLGKLHQMMEGEDWFNDDGWPDPLPEFGEPDFTKYFGLGINAYNDVIRISLPRNNLGGRLPFSEDFVQATMELRTINLESNLIEGGFPNAWWYVFMAFFCGAIAGVLAGRALLGKIEPRLSRAYLSLTSSLRRRICSTFHFSQYSNLTGEAMSDPVSQSMLSSHAESRPFLLCVAQILTSLGMVCGEPFPMRLGT